MNSLIVKAGLVVALGAAALLSEPTEAEAKLSTWCNVSIPANCQQMDEEDIRILCNGVCPQWEAAVCWESGNVVCLTDPM
jgi:hypothetical protein